MKIRIRQAVTKDIPVLRELIDASVRGLQTRDYTPSQIESALATVYGVDTQLIADGTYLVAEAEPGAGYCSRSSSVAAAGASGRPSMVETNGRAAKPPCSIPGTTPPKFAPSLSIPRGPGAASGA